MSPDFSIAVQVTIVGMALVFLTLVICALVISLLSRIFKPKPEEEETPAASVLPVPAAVGAPPTSTGNVPLASDEAAAVAVAIALAQRAAAGARSVGATFRRAPAMSRVPQSTEVDEIIVGEVVTVTAIDPGPATWSGYGRVKAAQ
jgi:Na+-transporting methylmalonyl-CoA/oxaloacetate decarboxylase gamma subunit